MEAKRENEAYKKPERLGPQKETHKRKTGEERMINNKTGREGKQLQSGRQETQVDESKRGK